MAGINNQSEPSTAPQPDRWYNLTLGGSFKDHNPSKFCIFRYDFKPASIDKNQRGTLYKGKDNKINVEFQNIQPGKAKVIFEGTSEDYKDNDAVLFFDGESFRLERLHRAVKRLRHNRLLGESTGGAAASAGLTDANSPPVGKGVKHQPLNKDVYHPLPVEVERIEIGNFKNSDAKPRQEKTVEHSAVQPNSSIPPQNLKNDDQDEPLDIMNADEDESYALFRGVVAKDLDFDINKPHQADTYDEIANIDASDGEADKGTDAAEDLRAQVNAEGRELQTSSSSASSGVRAAEVEVEVGAGAAVVTVRAVVPILLPLSETQTSNPAYRILEHSDQDIQNGPLFLSKRSRELDIVPALKFAHL